MSDIKDPISASLIESANKYTKTLATAADVADKLADKLIKLSDINSKVSTSDTNNTKKKKELTEVEKELDRVISQTEKNIAKRQVAEAGLTEELVKSQLASQKASKAVKDKLQAEEKAAKQAQLSAEALNKQRQKALQVIAKQEQAEKDLRSALEREVKTEEDAIIQNKALRQARRKLDATTQEGKDAVDEFNERINKNSEFLAGNADAATAAKDNVGKYQESIEAALSSSDKFSGGTTNIISNFVEIGQAEGGIKGFFKTFVSGIGAATKAGLKFILTPIGAVIAAIVIGIGLFTAAISRNESASDGFSKIWAGITTVIDEVIGRIFKFIGAIGKFITGDFSGAVNDTKEAFTGLGEAIETAYNEGRKLLELQIALEETTIKNTKAIAEQNAISEKQNAIADDATRSFAIREAAAEKARVAEQEAASLSVEQSKQALAIIDLQVRQAERQGTINRALRQEQADAAAAVIDAESALTVAILNNDKTRAELKQDRLEKDLDILIDGFDNQKTINERLLADDRLTLQKRAEILEETRSQADESFDKQIETIEQFTNANVNANDLVSTSNAVALNEKIRSLGLSEIIEGRLLEIIRERRIATQDLNDAERDLAKKRIKIDGNLSSVLAENAKRTKDDLLSAEEKFNKDSLDGLKKSSEAKIKVIQDEAKQREDIARTVKDMTVDLSAQGAQAITDILFEAASQRRDEELERVEEQREEDLELIDEQTEEDLAAEDAKVEAGIQTEEQAEARKKNILAKSKADKEKIEADADAKAAAIKTKQAKAEKAAAIASIQIDTAAAIIKTGATMGYPAAIPFVALAAIQGAIQTAAVLATPIPKFFKGTSSSPDTFIAGDHPTKRGASEMLIDKLGNVSMTPDRPTLYSGMKGTEVVPNNQVKERLAQMAVKGDSFNFSDRNMVDAINRNTKAVKSQSSSNHIDNKVTTSRGRRMQIKHKSFTDNMGA